MSEDTTPGLFARLLLAWVAYFRTIFDAQFAAGVVRLREGKPALPESASPEPKNIKKEQPKAHLKAEEPTKEEPKVKPAVVLRESGPEAALQLLALLQREGRLIDFLEEDVASFSDAQIGAAARVVHDGCRRALREHFPMESVRSEEEGSDVTLAKGYDAQLVRITGNVTGEAPFRGKLAHRGWKVREVKLPKMTEGHDASVVCAAEVELLAGSPHGRGAT